MMTMHYHFLVEEEGFWTPLLLRVGDVALFFGIILIVQCIALHSLFAFFGIIIIV